MPYFAANLWSKSNDVTAKTLMDITGNFFHISDFQKLFLIGYYISIRVFELIIIQDFIYLMNSLINEIIEDNYIYLKMNVNKSRQRTKRYPH